MIIESVVDRSAIEQTAGPKRLVQCRVLEPVSLAAHNGGVVVMETFRDHIEATG
jgi:hypothetical protein